MGRVAGQVKEVWLLGTLLLLTLGGLLIKLIRVINSERKSVFQK